MGILDDARERFQRMCVGRGIALEEAVEVHPLAPEDAIGSKASDEFVLKRGKERVIEARFGRSRGQAFTDRPTAWSGTLAEALALDIGDVANRAVFVAVLNAVCRELGLAEGTCHCKDDEPRRCGVVLAEEVERRFGADKRLALVGLQPGFLEALSARFGPERVRVLDLDPENIGQRKCGVVVEDGATQLAALCRWCDVGLATGSSLVNATIDEIASAFAREGKPLVFYGNTISATAALVGLDRFCPFGR